MRRKKKSEEEEDIPTYIFSIFRYDSPGLRRPEDLDPRYKYQPGSWFLSRLNPANWPEEKRPKTGALIPSIDIDEAAPAPVDPDGWDTSMDVVVELHNPEDIFILPDDPGAIFL